MDVALPPVLARSTAVNGLAYRPDGARLATADTALRVAAREGERLIWSRSLASADPKVATAQRVRGIAYSPGGETLFVLASDGLLALDDRTGATLWSYVPPRSLGFLVISGMAIAVREDGLVAASFDNGALGAWSASGEALGLWRDVDAPRRLAFLRDGRLLGDDSFGLSVYDVEARTRLFRTPLRDRSFGLAAARDGNVAVRTLHEAWQIAPSGAVFARTPVEAGLPTLAYHPFEPLLALGGERAVLLVDQDGEPVRRVELPTKVTSLAFSPAGRLTVGGGDGTLYRPE